MDRSRDRIVALGLFFLAFALYRIDIFGPSVWTDEAVTLHIVRMPLGQLWATVLQSDINPPLSYLIDWLWARLRSDMGWMRLLSAFFGAGTCAVLFCLARDLYSRRAAFLAAALYLATPLALALARQVRYSTLLALLVLAATRAFLALLRKPSKGRAVSYSLWALAAAYTHYFAFFMLSFHLILFLSTRSPARSFRPFALAAALFVLGYAPWLPVLFHQFFGRQDAGLVSDFPIVALVPLVLVYFTQGWTLWTLPDFWKSRLDVLAGGITPDWTVVLFALPFAACVLGGLLVRFENPLSRKTTAGFVLVPIGAFVFFSCFTPLFSPQYFLAYLPASILACAAFLDRLMRTFMIGGIAAVAVVFIVPLGEVGAYIENKGTTEDWRGIAAVVTQYADQGDRVVVPNLPARLCLNPYPLGPLPVFSAGDGLDPMQVVSQAMAQQAVGEAIKEAGRVWLVEYYPRRYDPQGFLPRQLARFAFEIPLRYLSPRVVSRYEHLFSDPRLRLRLFVVDPDRIASLLPRSIDMADLASIRHDILVSGIYPGEGPMRWTARQAAFHMALFPQDRLCLEGNAPSMLFRKSVIGATLSVATIPPRDPDPARIEKEIELMGIFWFCMDVGPMSGPVKITLSCHDSFIPDALFSDGDQSEKCLMLRRIWCESAKEQADD